MSDTEDLVGDERAPGGKAVTTNRRAADNPWGLTTREGEALDAVIKAGSTHEAAVLLGISLGRLEALVSTAKIRMRCANRVHHLVKWDRWQRGDSLTRLHMTRDVVASGPLWPAPPGQKVAA